MTCARQQLLAAIVFGLLAVTPGGIRTQGGMTIAAALGADGWTNVVPMTPSEEGRFDSLLANASWDYSKWPTECAQVENAAWRVLGDYFFLGIIRQLGCALRLSHCHGLGPCRRI